MHAERTQNKFCGERGTSTVLSFPKDNDAEWLRAAPRHMKPVALLRELVRRYSKPGDVILDPAARHAGTGVAALLEGRRFIGGELQKEPFAAGLGWLSSDFSETVVPAPPLRRARSVRRT